MLSKKKKRDFRKKTQQVKEISPKEWKKMTDKEKEQYMIKRHAHIHVK